MSKGDDDVWTVEDLVDAYLEPAQADRQEAIERAHALVDRVRAVKPLKTKAAVIDELKKLQRQCSKLLDTVLDLSDEAVDILKHQWRLAESDIEVMYGDELKGANDESEINIVAGVGVLDYLARLSLIELPGNKVHASTNTDKDVCAIGSLILFEAFRPNAARPKNSYLEAFARGIYRLAFANRNNNLERAFTRAFKLWDLHKTRKI